MIYNAMGNLGYLARGLLLSSVLFVGLACCPHASAAKPCLGQGEPRAVFVGDSLTWGHGPRNSWPTQLAGMCGWHEVLNDGRGGTGLFANGHGTSASYINRVPTEVAPFSPSIVFITSYFNDTDHTPSDLATALAALIDAVHALPTHPTVVVTGIYDPTGVNGAPYTQIDPALRAVCVQRAVPFIEPRTGTVYDSSGKGTDVGGPWITEANKAHYISDDGFHPNDDGLVYVAQRTFDAIQALS